MLNRKVEDIFKPASNREILDRRAAPIRDKFKLGDSVQTTGGTGKIIKLTDKDMLIKWDLADMLDPLYYSFDNDIDRETLLRDVHVIREGKLFQYAFFEEDIFKPAGKRELKNRKSTEIEQAKARIMFKDEGFPEHSIYYGYKGEDGRFNDIGLIYNNRSLYPSSFNEDCIKIRCDVSIANGNKQFKVGELHKAKQWAERNVVGYLTNTYIDQVDEDIFQPADKPELDRRKVAQQDLKRKEDAEKQAQYTKRLKALNKIPVKWDKKDEGSANGSKTVYFLGKYVDVDFTCDIEGGSPQTREDPGEPAYPMLATITSAVDEDGRDVPYTEALVEVVGEEIDIDDVDTSGWDEGPEDDWREDR